MRKHMAQHLRYHQTCRHATLPPRTVDPAVQQDLAVREDHSHASPLPRFLQCSPLALDDCMTLPLFLLLGEGL